MQSRALLGIFFALLTASCSTGDSGLATEIHEFFQELRCKISTCRIPASLELEAIPVLYSAEAESALSATVFNPTHEVLADFPVQFEVQPPAVAVITQARSLRCTKTGNATLLARAGAATGITPIKCRLVERIELADKLRLIIPAAPLPLGVKVFDTENRLLADLPPQLTVADAEVLTIEDGKLVAKQVGMTRVTASAGDKSIKTLVTVIRKVETRALSLEDGKDQLFPLPPGNYEVEVNVRSASSSYGVTLTWVRGRGCDDKDEAQEIMARCTLAAAGGFIIENPTTFGFGPAAEGAVTIYEVP